MTDTDTPQLTLEDLFGDSKLTFTNKQIKIADLPEDPPLLPPSNGLKDSIARVGVLNPLIVEETEDGFMVVAGKRRLAAAREVGLKVVPCRIMKNPNPFSDPIVSLMENGLRKQNPIAELEAIKQLLTREGMTEDLIAEATGLSKQTIRKRMKLLTAPTEVLQGVEEGTVAMGTAEQVVKLPSATQQRLVGKLADTGKLSLSDVDEEKTARAQQAAQDLAPIFAVKVNPYDKPLALLKEAGFNLPEDAPSELAKALRELITATEALYIVNEEKAA